MEQVFLHQYNLSNPKKYRSRNTVCEHLPFNLHLKSVSLNIDLQVLNSEDRVAAAGTQYWLPPLPHPTPRPCFFAQDTNGHSTLSKWLPVVKGQQPQAWMQLGYNVTKPSNFPDKMCAFNHAPKNSNVGTWTQGSTSEVTLAFSPLCTSILGGFPPHPSSTRPVFYRGRAEGPLLKGTDTGRNRTASAAHRFIPREFKSSRQSEPVHRKSPSRQSLPGARGWDTLCLPAKRC